MSQNGSLPSSQLLSSSISSLSPSRQSASQVSKVYKQASQLFLTRRLSEALSTLEPVVSVPPSPETRSNEDEDSPVLAPIATVSSNLRIKVWNLYITLLNAIVDLGPEEGKKLFGHKEWKALVSRVRDGDVWEDVVTRGYRGREGIVDADVVYPLATLLLTQAPTQTLTQQRLESWLSASSHPTLDVSSQLQMSPSGRHRMHQSNGTDTPKDLTGRIKILELFTLHILPRNEEWDYAREFISMSEILDEERKESFLQTLNSLREEKKEDNQREVDIQRERDAELERQRKEEVIRRAEEAAAEEEMSRSSSEKNAKAHKRTSSEVDYGIEKPHPNGTTKSQNGKAPSKLSKATSMGGTQFSPPPEKPNQTRKPEKQQRDMFKHARLLMQALQRLVKNMAESMSANPMLLLRTLLFLVGIITAFSRKDVRDRVRRITGVGWDKLRRTLGMGVKVSYI